MPHSGNRAAAVAPVETTRVRRPWLFAAAILVAGLAIRLPLLPLVGHVSDTVCFYRWAGEASRRPVGTLYADEARLGDLALNYPPVYVYVLSMLPGLHDAIAGGVRWSDPVVEQGLRREAIRKSYAAFAAEVAAAGCAARPLEDDQLRTASSEAHMLGLDEELARAAPRTYGELSDFVTRYVVGEDHLDARHRLVVLLLKMPPLLADIALAAIVLAVGWRLVGAQQGLIACAAVFLNPVLVYDSAYWGQADSVAMVPALACLVALLARRWAWVGALLTLALLTKLQTVIVVPVIAATLLAAIVARGARSGAREERHPLAILGAFAGAASATALLLVLPLIRSGTLGGLVRLYMGLTSQYPYLSVRAFNLWWLLTPGNATLSFPKLGFDNVPLLLGMTPKTLGMILFAGATAGVVAMVLRRAGDREAVVVGALATAMAFFCLATEIHERYGFAIIPFAVLAWLFSSPRYRLVVAAASATHFVNLVLGGLEGRPMGAPGESLLAALASSRTLTGAIALANLALLGVVLARVGRLGREGSPNARAAAPGREQHGDTPDARRKG